MRTSVFDRRLARHYDELKWLYCELYHDGEEAFRRFVEMLRAAWRARKKPLRDQDALREADPDWYRRRDLLGMMLYTDAFAGDLKGVQGKLDYLQECGVDYLHLMPLLESPKGRSDGGYAVSDFRKVQPGLGTMEDLEELADSCRRRGICLCLDFVMNHTSEDHAWAKKARANESGYRDRYFFYDDWTIPREFEKTVPQVFPTTAPGSFTQLEDGQVVMTNFYPYQWDLNYANPAVFNDMTENRAGRDPAGRGPLYLEAAGDPLPEPAPGTYAGPDAAHGGGGRLPRRAAAGGGGDGARQGRPVLRHAGEAGVSYAL